MSGMRVVLVCMTVSGCGPYHLATDISGPVGAPMETDTQLCKDEAEWWSQSAEAQARMDAAGAALPLVGIAMALEVSKQQHRAFFYRCMADRGYTMRMGVD